LFGLKERIVQFNSVSVMGIISMQGEFPGSESLKSEITFFLYLLRVCVISCGP
jgi:hypothetical protein